MKRFGLLVILALALGQNAFARDSGKVYFDEIFDRDGHLRPQYVELYDDFVNRSKAERNELLRKSEEAYRGDNKQHDIPLIMTAKEFDANYAAGVKQRARAILAFLQDYYSGEHRFRKIVDEKIIRKIVERNGEVAYQKYIDGKNLSYFYGPDLMRNAKGETVVLEDNSGAVGLAFDLRVAFQYMLESNPQILDHITPRNPDDFYRKLAETYKARAEKNGGKAVLLVSPVRTDGEDARARAIFEDYGIEIVYPNGRDLKLKAYEHGVYTYSKSQGMKSLEKVGYVILSADPVWYDNTHEATYERSVIEEAKALEFDKDVPLATRRKLGENLRQGYSAEQIAGLAEVLNAYNADLLKPKPFSGLMDAILSGKVGSNISPGTEFTSDKEFYIHVENFIRFYLKEEPILKNQATWLFANAKGELREGLFNRVFDNFKYFVVKPVDGRGGDGVAVGPNTKREDIAKIKAKVSANPSGWLVQEYVTPSRLDGLIIDRRVIANAFLDKGKFSAVVANVSASRGNFPKGSGRVNLSGDGRAIAVLVADCEGRLTKRPSRGD